MRYDGSLHQPFGPVHHAVEDGVGSGIPGGKRLANGRLPREARTEQLSSSPGSVEGANGLAIFAPEGLLEGSRRVPNDGIGAVSPGLQAGVLA